MTDMISSLEILLQNLISQLEWIMLFAIIGGGIYLFFDSKGYPLLKIKTAFKLLFLQEESKGISRFQALSAVLAATVGLGCRGRGAGFLVSVNSPVFGRISSLSCADLVSVFWFYWS